MTHTPEPWKVHGGMLGHKGDIFVPTAKSIRDCHHVARCFAPKPSKQPVCELQIIQMEREAISTIEANARRIVACVNALSGISTEAIEAGGVQELVEAAREARECLRLGAVVPLRDTANYDEVSALGNRIGFGALMATASLAWRDECGEMAGDKRHAVELRAMAMRLIEMQMERRKVALPPGMSVALQGIQSAVNQLDLEQDHPQ